MTEAVGGYSMLRIILGARSGGYRRNSEWIHTAMSMRQRHKKHAGGALLDGGSGG